MKPLIIKCKWAPKNLCVNLFGVLVTKDKSWIDEKIINHEKIHTRQEKEMLFIPFYIFYVVEWLIKLTKYKNRHKAYMNISFEREAYKNGDDLTYLKRRKPYAWTKFLRK